MYKVLIVEDDPMVAMINEQYLKMNKNVELVGKCSDGESALNFLKEHEVDLLILDVYMPKMDGLKTLREIRNRQIAVDAIMVTAANDKESLEEALHLGIVDYLVKPFTFDRFQVAIEKYITQNKALQDMDNLSQRSIDFIIENNHKKGENLFPKGIQDKTLKRIADYLKAHGDTWFTGEEVAQKVGLTGVTVRRYMNYLAESGKIVSEMDYETGGRPSMRYKAER